MDTGQEMRMDILRRAADQQIVKPLRTHGWSASIMSEHRSGEYLLVKATKGEHERVVALMYSSATDNRHYRALAPQVSHIFINGQLYMLESFAYGIETPVLALNEFFPVMVEWNKEIAPSAQTREQKERPWGLRITAEDPLESIWAHLHQLASVKLSEKMILARAEHDGVSLSAEQAASKALGVAYCVRSAADYFRGVPHESMNKRILSLYYGSMALASAEMLADPGGYADLDQVEGTTLYGHGLFTLPPTTHRLGDMVVGVLGRGFFPNWMSALGHDTSAYPSKKPKSPSDLQKLPPQMHVTLAQLLAALPEVSHILGQVYEVEPSWVSVGIDNDSSLGFDRRNKDSTYVRFYDESGQVTRARLESAGWPIAEITQVNASSEYEQHVRFRARVDHPGKKFWFQALPVHHSPFFSGSALIMSPLAGVAEHRAICMSLLYALSILVRYMPSAWRRVEGGDWDENFALIRTTLTVMERLLPEAFLASIRGERVASRQPGAFG